MLRFNKKRKTSEKQEKTAKNSLTYCAKSDIMNPQKAKSEYSRTTARGHGRHDGRPLIRDGPMDDDRKSGRGGKSKAMLPPDRRTARKTFCSPRPETDAKNAHIAHIQPFNGSHQAGTLPARQHGMSTAPADGAAARRSRLDWRLTV